MEKVTLIRVDCPSATFDLAEGEEVYIKRRKRIAIWRIDEINASKSSEEMYKKLAILIPEWKGVCDCETGDALANPGEDPSVFGHIDFDQMTWLSEIIKAGPGKLRKSGSSGQT